MRQIILVAGIAWVHGVALAATAPLSSHYEITNSSAETKTVAKDSSKEALVRDYLFNALSPALVDSTYITSIQETEGKTEVDKGEHSNAVTYKKTSQIFVSLAMPARISVLFSMEQRHRTCKSKSEPETSSLSYFSYGYSSCEDNTGVLITGPLQVYGDYASSLQVEKILRNKQDLGFLLSKKSGGGLELRSQFNINSALFEENLGKFLEFFGVVLKSESSVGISPTGGAQIAMTRQRLLLATARYLRQVNERMLK